MQEVNSNLCYIYFIHCFRCFNFICRCAMTWRKHQSIVCQRRRGVIWLLLLRGLCWFHSRQQNRMVADHGGEMLLIPWHPGGVRGDIRMHFVFNPEMNFLFITKPYCLTSRLHRYFYIYTITFLPWHQRVSHALLKMKLVHLWVTKVLLVPLMCKIPNPKSPHDTPVKLWSLVKIKK